MIYIKESYYRNFNIDDLGYDIGIKKLDEIHVNKLKNLIDILVGKESLFNKENTLISTLFGFFDNCDIILDFQKNKLIYEIREYIREHFLEEISLDFLQSKYDINKFVLIRTFKLIYNSTPSSYQLQLKADYGKHLLRNYGDLSAIALEAGYYDQAHFSKEFKKSYGITPLKYYKSIAH